MPWALTLPAKASDPTSKSCASRASCPRRLRNAEAIRPLTCTIAFQSAMMQPRGAAYFGGGGTQWFSEIIIPDLLSSNGVALVSDSFPLQQQDGSTTISARWEQQSNDRPALKNKEHAHTTKNITRARAHTTGLI